LSRLPFEMLPLGDKFLVEEKTISYEADAKSFGSQVQSPMSKVQSPSSWEILTLISI
jgi:hypothetical protein